MKFFIGILPIVKYIHQSGEMSINIIHTDYGSAL